MLNIETTPPGLLGISIQNEVSQQEINQTIQTLLQRILPLPGFRMYANVQNFGAWNGLLAFCEVFKSKIQEGKAFEKCAVITDKTWLINVKGLAEHLGAGTNLKIFSPQEKDAALGWLATPSAKKRIALEEINLSSRKVIGFRIHGALDRQLLQVFNDKLDRQIKRENKLRLLVELGAIESAREFRSIILSLNAATRYRQKSVKVAVVLPVDFAFDFFKEFSDSQVRLKIFDHAEGARARKWLS